MSDLDKALGDYTATICDLLDVEFRKAKRLKNDLGKSIDIADDRDADTQIDIDFPPTRSGGTDEFDHGQDSGSQRTPSPTIRTGKPKPKPKTTNPLKVMGKLTVLATLVYAVFTFFF